MDKGLYIVEFRLSRRSRLRVGALGSFTFPAGLYLYVGSAQRNRAARLERHGRADKPLRWHIDYLSTKAKMLGAVLVPGTRQKECALARKLAAVATRVVPGFGASDCGCEGHLFYAGRTPSACQGSLPRDPSREADRLTWLSRAGIRGARLYPDTQRNPPKTD